MRRGGEVAALVFAAAFFLAGAFAGAFAGSSALPAGEEILPGDGSIYGYGTFAGLLLSCSKYHLAVLIFSTSLLGVLFIPAVLAFRGFALACSTAWLASVYPERGAALALIILGLPSLLTVPALFVTAQWGELFALRLLSFFTHRPLSAPPPRRDNRVLAVVLLLFGAAAMELFVVPPVVEMLI